MTTTYQFQMRENEFLEIEPFVVGSSAEGDVCDVIPLAKFMASEHPFDVKARIWPAVPDIMLEPDQIVTTGWKSIAELHVRTGMDMERLSRHLEAWSTAGRIQSGHLVSRGVKVPIFRRHPMVAR